MSENLNLIAGLLVSFVPLFVAGYLMLNKQPPIFRMFVAMLTIGVGYLWATGAVEDIGAKVTGKRNLAVPVENAAAPAAPKPAAAEAPKAAPEAPKAAAAPADAPKDAAPPVGAQPAGAH